ncbi:MAG: hypothetical protein C0619_03545 [Desulfuromonas sp.]|nr:MAG: hypothetical protein C0619_03545 [Desulfuromonas sp.]
MEMNSLAHRNQFQNLEQDRAKERNRDQRMNMPADQVGIWLVSKYVIKTKISSATGFIKSPATLNRLKK